MNVSKMADKAQAQGGDADRDAQHGEDDGCRTVDGCRRMEMVDPQVQQGDQVRRVGIRVEVDRLYLRAEDCAMLG